MRITVWILFAVLLVLHQWDLAGGNETLVGGVIPLPLVYHAGLCLAASLVWWQVTVHAWPDDAEVPDDAPADREGDA